MTDNPRPATRWTTQSTVVDDKDLLYQATIGNLDVIYRHRLYAKIRKDDDQWAPHHDHTLGWVVLQPSTLHVYYREDRDGILRPLRCESEEEAASEARRLNAAERRRRAGVVESAVRQAARFDR